MEPHYSRTYINQVILRFEIVPTRVAKGLVNCQREGRDRYKKWPCCGIVDHGSCIKESCSATFICPHCHVDVRLSPSIWTGPKGAPKRTNKDIRLDERVDLPLPGINPFGTRVYLTEKDEEIPEAPLDSVTMTIHIPKYNINVLSNVDQSLQDEIMFEPVNTLACAGFLAKRFFAFVLNSDLKPAEKSNECMICFESGQDMRVTACGHHAHFHCISEWLRRSQTCPLCREKVQYKSTRAKFEDLGVTPEDCVVAIEKMLREKILQNE